MNFQKAGLFFILLLFVMRFNLFADDCDSLNTWQIIGKDARSFMNDFSALGSNISDIGLKEAGNVLEIAALETILIINDEGIRDFFLKNQSKGADSYLSITNNFGELYTAAAIPAGVYLTGLISRNDVIRTTGRQLTEAMLLSGGITQLIKCVAGRARPYADKGSNYYKMFTLEESRLSFPSGHSTVAFTIATVLSYKIDRWWGYASLYTLAASTAIARMYFDKHWSSDVAMGAAIGTISGIAIMKAGEISEKKQNIGNFRIIPYGTGVFLCYSF